jgi:molecular chaperone GrpE
MKDKAIKKENVVEEVTIPVSELEELKQKVGERDDFYNKWMKVHAEFENTVKRMEKNQSERIKFANENIISQLFLIVDNFDMALASMEKTGENAAILEGIKMLQKEFHKILEDNGVVRMKTEGELFDPNIHEAVQALETDQHSDGQIIEEFRAGYMLNERLLRPAQVIVAKEKSE